MTIFSKPKNWKKKPQKKSSKPSTEKLERENSKVPSNAQHDHDKPVHACT